MDALKHFTRDPIVVPIVQGAYVLFCIYAFACDVIGRVRAKRNTSGAHASVTRGSTSMGRLHATYVALAFVILLLTLNVEVYKDRRAVFALLNLGLLAYLAFFNIWFRDKVLRLTNRAANIED